MAIPALTIAGSDPSGGAGVQADLKTFHQHGIYGMTVITLLTVQNTRSVTVVELVKPELVLAQLNAVLDDIEPKAIKTGALGSVEIIEVIASRLRDTKIPLVVDPVMISKHGSPLLKNEAISALVNKLFAISYLATPNIPEAEAILGTKITSLKDAAEAAKAITALGAKNVLIKGGHNLEQPVDTLCYQNEIYTFKGDHIDTPNTHGTGCVMSAAITSQLARGKDLPTAVSKAKEFIIKAIATNPQLGHGNGPINMMVAVE